MVDKVVSVDSDRKTLTSVFKMEIQAQKSCVSQKGQNNYCSIGNNIYVHVQNSLNNPQKISSLISVFESKRENRINIEIKKDNHHITLDVHPTDTVDSLKQKLEWIFEVETAKQFLVFGDRILQNDNIIQEFNIAHNDILRLFCVSHEDKILLLIQRIHGRLFGLEFSSKSTIKYVKTIIEREEGLPIDRQQLFLKNELVMQDEDKLCDYPTDQEIVFLAAKVMTEDMKQIFVFDSGRIIPIKIGIYETIEDLKKKIQLLKGFAPEMQRIVFLTKQLEDHSNMKDYVITDDSSFQLALRIKGGSDCDTKLQIRTSIGQIFFLGLYETFKEKTINQIKEEISKKNSKFFPENQILFLKNERLESDTKPLQLYVQEQFKSKGTIFLALLRSFNFLKSHDYDRKLELGPELILELVLKSYA